MLGTYCYSKQLGRVMGKRRKERERGGGQGREDMGFAAREVIGWLLWQLKPMVL